MTDIQLQATHIGLAHGNGGRQMRELIEQLFVRHLHNPLLDTQTDAACLPWPKDEVIISNDGFTVQPLEFPGGDIGSLAIHGTINDLAVSGAIPHYLSLTAILEEGLEIALLERIIKSMATTARENNVAIVTGDTKVVRRGEGSGLYLATTGIGSRSINQHLNPGQIQAGDAILVSGPIGNHAIAVMLAREQFGLSGTVCSDAASVLPLTRALLDYSGLRFMRDPTRGGLATVCHDIRQATGLGTRIQESAIPVEPAVRSVCDILGYDPLYLACEGRVVAVIAAAQAGAALEHWRTLAQGQQAAIIGTVTGDDNQQVILETDLGGERLLQQLEDDPLPRIC